MKKLLTVFFVFILCTGNITAGNEPANIHILSGKIVDKQNGEALAGVKIRIDGTDKFYYTDIEGNFSFTVAVATNSNITVDLVGYEPAIFKAAQLSLASEIILIPR
ncbi:MAG: carboxypeptidase-like regulatory domain-containing protein [Bacteroidia bacterium]